jgi:hypothetical protein
MSAAVVSLATLGELRNYVRETLCARDRLEIESTPLYAAEVKRGGRLCGYLFHIEGPRLLRNSALWSESDHRILFYDSIGTRFFEVNLSDSPALDEVEARAA